MQFLNYYMVKSFFYSRSAILFQDYIDTSLAFFFSDFVLLFLHIYFYQIPSYIETFKIILSSPKVALF